MLAGSLACLASARIAVLFMSGEPTIASRATSLRTSLRPLTPRTSAAMPKATRTAAAVYPPNSKSFLADIFLPPCGSGMAGFKRRSARTPSARRHTRAAGYYGNVRAVTTEQAERAGCTGQPARSSWGLGERLEEGREGHQEPEREQRARDDQHRFERGVLPLQERREDAPGAEEDRGRDDRLARKRADPVVELEPVLDPGARFGQRRQEAQDEGSEAGRKQ